MTEVSYISPTLLVFLFNLEGYSSARAGYAIVTNPYEKGSVQHLAWQAGWLDGRQAPTEQRQVAF